MEQLSPSQEELKKIKKAQEDADPTTYSHLEEAVDFGGYDHVYRRGKKIADLNSNEFFFKILKNPELQRFISLLSKGILHVSDVIKVGDHYFSKNMSLEKIQSSQKMELKAEIFILNRLFYDWDKYTGNYYKGDLGNVNQDPKGRFAHFDYNVATLSAPNPSPLSLRFITKIHGHSVEDEKTLAETKRIIKEKIDMFRQRIDDEIFFGSVIKKTGIGLQESVPGKLFFEELSFSEMAKFLKQILLIRIAFIEKELIAPDRV